MRSERVKEIVRAKGGSMNGSVLVTYASKHGSTGEVADAVAGRLREHGLEVELLPVTSVEHVERFDAIVLGAALYMGRLHPDARHFLRGHRVELADKLVGVFALGPLTLSEHDVDGAWRQLEACLAKVPELQPVETAIFGGVVRPTELRFPFNRMAASDARDWAAIQTWTDTVAAALGAAQLTAVPA
jgi:menaquinone-dependent protoporphyrinogen oxidase